MTKWSCYSTPGQICWCSIIFIKGYTIIYLMRLRFIMVKNLIFFVSAYSGFLLWQIFSMTYRPNFRNSNSIFRTIYAWNSWCCSIMVCFFFQFSFPFKYIYLSNLYIDIFIYQILLSLIYKIVWLFFKYTEVRGLVNKKHVQEGHEQVQQALLDYTLTCYPSIPVCWPHIFISILFFLIFRKILYILTYIN